jgi:hypothetical protein
MRLEGEWEPIESTKRIFVPGRAVNEEFERALVELIKIEFSSAYPILPNPTR